MGPPTDIFGSFLWNVGYSICHQLPERSFFIGGLQMPVCARDTGTYLGFLAVLGIYLFGRRYDRGKAPDWFVIAFATGGMVLYAVDALSSYLGMRSTSNDLRLLAGMAFGAGMTFLLLSASSIIMFKAKEIRMVFSWKDILAVLPILALASVPFMLNLGIVTYYFMATLVISGYLLMLFLLLSLFIATIKSWDLVDRPNVGRLVLISIGTEVLILAILWIAKYFTWSILPISG